MWEIGIIDEENTNNQEKAYGNSWYKSSTQWSMDSFVSNPVTLIESPHPSEHTLQPSISSKYELKEY